jgi:arylsulfatase
MITDGKLTHVCRPSRTLLMGMAASLCMIGAAPAQTVAAEPTQSESASGKPNIVIIWGDDIGQSNISAYSHGLMGYQTPNIDAWRKKA